jgi:DNA-binding SARP family transcriptional activator
MYSGIAASRDQWGVSRYSRAGQTWPVVICILGDFRLLKSGRPLHILSGGKMEALLINLALASKMGCPRETLLSLLWPEQDGALATESLNSLIYRVRRLLGDALGGAKPVVRTHGRYRLNTAAGIAVDAALMEALAEDGNALAQAAENSAALEKYRMAVELYQGDLCAGSDINAVVERQRLLDLHANLMVRLASHEFDRGDDEACLRYALNLLAHDPSREDVHRLVIRCYFRKGERGRALRQYRLCEAALRQEFDAPPEPATTRLFDEIRLHPDSVSAAPVT